MRRLPLCLLLVLWCAPVLAHKTSDSYLSIQVRDASIEGRWDIALRDLDSVIGLDGDGDGLISGDELRARDDAVVTYALSQLRVSADGHPCASRPTAQPVLGEHTDGAYAVLRFAVDCSATARSLVLSYALLFDLDPLHRGLLRLDYEGDTRTAVFTPGQPSREFQFALPSAWRGFLEFVREGVWHIWIGYDHILFLLSLLLPAVVRRESGGWRPVDDFRTALWAVVKIVTAFTVAHSITLSLAAFGVLDLPSRWVESAIAASVALAALNNLYPIVHDRLWGVAFGFGLVHGLGFAGVLGDLGLPRGSLLTALVGFNLGVETGQLAIVGTFLPLAFALRHSWAYRRLALGLGSVLIAGLAATWFVERSLGLGMVL